MPSTKNTPKIADPLGEARKCLNEGRYAVTYHAEARQIERLVPLPDVIHAIEYGYHEKRKDRFDAFHDTWNYSVRGKATDKRNLRVVISFETNSDLLIITVVVLKG